jgi:hypothetical protein
MTALRCASDGFVATLVSTAPEPFAKKRVDHTHALGFPRQVALIDEALGGLVERVASQLVLARQCRTRRRQTVRDAGQHHLL